MTNLLLKADARNRALRTLLQTVVLVVIAPAADAALQIVQRYILESATGGHGFDWRQIAVTAMYAAGSGATMSLIAYVHRLKVDPSPIPSAPPPVAVGIRPSPRWPAVE